METPSDKKIKGQLIDEYKILRNKYDTEHDNIRKQIKKEIEKKNIMQVDDKPEVVEESEIIKKIKLKLDPDDVEEYGLSENIGEVFNNLEGDEDEKVDEIASIERERHKFKNQEYTEKQLEKTFERFLLSYSTEKTFNSKIPQCDYQTILKYLCFIKDNPRLALPTLLWLDTFHDFKEERLMASVEVEEGSRRKEKIELNKIIDYICYRIYSKKHWAKLSTNEPAKNKVAENKVKDCVDIGYKYTFDKMYQNSFFTFDNNYNLNANECYGSDKCRVKVKGFHNDVKHTVLRPLVETQYFNPSYTQQQVAKLLYDVSNVFIANADGWESDFLYMYMLYNFEFNIGINTRDKFLDDLRQISNDSISRKDIPYYAKDVDKASSHYLKGDLVVLPASLFDANPSNSSKSPGSFVSIPKTTIPYCNGYNFIYEFNNESKSDDAVKPCKLTLEYGDGNKSYAVCNRDKKSLSSPTCNTTSREELKTINSIIKNISKLINSIDIYSDINKDEIQNEIIKLNTSIKTLYFGSGNCVKLPDKQGMSPVDIISIIIGILVTVGETIETVTKKSKKPRNNTPRTLSFENQNNNHPLSPISCKVLDFWVALKRIGDFGQILQCKQLGIPLFTNDNMQILISMAACSSVVFTIDNSKAIWYNGFKDAFMKNELSREYLCDYATDDCTIKRIERLYIYSDLNKIDIIQDILMNLANRDKDFEASSKGSVLLLKTSEELDKELRDSKLSDTLYYGSKENKTNEYRKQEYRKRLKGIKTFIQKQKNRVYKGVINELLKYDEYNYDKTCSEASKSLKEERGVNIDIANIREHDCKLSIETTFSIPLLSSAQKNPIKKQKVYEVEKIIGHTIDTNGNIKYKVKWKGYSDASNSDEPETSFDKGNEILKAYKAVNNIT
jgi:acetolactate synthase small subunit